MSRPVLLLLVLFAAFSAAAGLRAAPPVEFAFRAPARAGNPFARELWAEVATPDGRTLLLPAFFRGAGVWAVRTRAAAAGTYRFGAVTETVEDHRPEAPGAAVAPAAGPAVPLPGIEPVGLTTVDVAAPEPLGGPVQIDPRAPRHFVDGAGNWFYPFGANFAWAPGEPVANPRAYYPPTFAAARRAGLNWARVWMAHWSRLNLDWAPEHRGPSPTPGTLDLEVAGTWDRIVAAAEANAVRLQVVLQHHGQYSSAVNSNWAINPWNVANGGFLATPAEFFTSDEARRYTRRKFRYIVARWGYSPAVFAWELFNEVKWVDARTGPTATATSNAAVAAWHAEMARLIRRVDPHRHLITTSDDALTHPLYEAMDFLQPHAYAANMLAAVRRFDVPAAALDRPVFYGEMGDDNLNRLPDRLRRNGYASLPIAWAGVMGDSRYAAQVWYVDRLLAHGRFDELGALARFVRAAQLDRRPDLRAFSPAVTGGPRVPLTLEPGSHWHRQPPPTVAVPFDGSVPAEWGEIPRTLVSGQPVERRFEPEPFPHRMTLQLEYPRDATAVLRFAGASPRGGMVRVTLDGALVGERVWPDVSGERSPPPQPPTEFLLPMKPGPRTLVIENPHGTDWVEFESLRTGVEVPAIAAAGRRADDRLALWVYHRTGVFSEREPAPAAAMLQLATVPAGRWRVTWWDVVQGRPAATRELDHAGGTLALETPPVSRYTAGWLERF